MTLSWEYLRRGSKLDPTHTNAGRAAATDGRAMEAAISATEEVLRDAEAMRFAAVTPDSVTIAVIGDQIEVLPHGRLLYHPVGSPGESSSEQAFTKGEAFEYADNDPRRAATWFQALARDAAAPVKAGAFVRAARNLVKAGDPGAALAAYSEAARLATTAIGEVPTELFARSARCRLLSDLARDGDLKREALELRELLLDGRWRISRQVFETHLESASAWAAAGEPPATHRLALSDAVDALWSSRPDSAPAGEVWTGHRSTLRAGGIEFTVLSQRLGHRTHVLIAGPLYVHEQWKSKAIKKAG